jgi:colanic acid/amylovoran biosynthesis glycosyltransferase
MANLGAIHIGEMASASCWSVYKKKNMKKIRIAIVTNSFPKISETFIFNKVAGLVDAGFDITVIAHGSNDDRSFFEKRSVLQKINIVYSLNTFSTMGQLILFLNYFIKAPARNISLLKKIYRENGDIKKMIISYLKLQPFIINEFDIIHFEFSGIAVSYLSELNYLENTKISLSCRGSAEKSTPLFKPERKEQLSRVFKHSSLVHCVSNNMAEVCSAYGLDRSKVLINFPSINIKIFNRTVPYVQKQDATLTLLSVGRLHWKKGYPYALLAVKKIISDYDIPIRYEIIGGGPEKEQIIFMINELGLNEHVFLLGNKSSQEVKEKLEMADIFLLPSLSEGISNSAMEAMAMKVPIISTNIDGMGELIDDSKDGFLVQPYDPDEIAQKVMSLYKNFELRKQIGQQAREKVKQQFNLDSQIQKFVTAYTKLVNKTV